MIGRGDVTSLHIAHIEKLTFIARRFKSPFFLWLPHTNFEGGDDDRGYGGCMVLVIFSQPCNNFSRRRRWAWLQWLPYTVLRSTAVPQMTSLRRLQFGQINSHRYIWVFKSPECTPPEKVTKKHYGNRTTIKEIARCTVGAAGP